MLRKASPYTRRGARWAKRIALHPRYTATVGRTLLQHPRLVVLAARKGSRPALLAECDRLYPGPRGSFSSYEAGFWGQVFLFDEYEVSSLDLGHRPLVVDVGANVGFFSWRVAASHPGARVVAFEPQGENFDRLRQLFEDVGIEGETVDAACGDHEGSATLYLRNSFTHTVEPSMHPDMDSGSDSVKMVTLDGHMAGRRWGEPVALMKIDVEGAEVQVLRGAGETLSRTANVVLEYHSDQSLRECSAILTASGFTCRPKRYWGGAPGEGLLLCRRMA
ncbi:MAG: FkbM family methyltransferase [Actinomycetota bacterium]|nr:FkbM family methyltransferase [Actinomycetota bacterium]